MSSTSAVDIIIQAVLPVEIWSASTRYGAVAAPGSATCEKAGAAKAASTVPRPVIFPLMTTILANGIP